MGRGRRAGVGVANGLVFGVSVGMGEDNGGVVAVAVAAGIVVADEGGWQAASTTASAVANTIRAVRLDRVLMVWRAHRVSQEGATY
ncbi:MAG: hypothetical protein O2884_04755 [Chloroflexi bacterium]|nr:hypothetical protein [Chloroflexota bacterium]